MANEELTQRGYLASGSLKGAPFGDFEELNLGATRVSELLTAGVEALVPESIEFSFSAFKPPKSPAAAKPDRVFLQRERRELRPVAAAECFRPPPTKDRPGHRHVSGKVGARPMAEEFYVGRLSRQTATCSW